MRLELFLWPAAIGCSLAALVYTLAALGNVIAKPSQWPFKTQGKPHKMLQVGRLPALGCTCPFGLSSLQTTLGMRTNVISMRRSLWTTPNLLWNLGYQKPVMNIIALMVRLLVEELMKDCWMANQRSKDGDLEPDYHRFPSGIKSLADRVHSMGLKFGIYESAGHLTCQHLPGSLGFEAKDAKLFASWGILLLYFAYRRG